jgi:hypothetical protein
MDFLQKHLFSSLITVGALGTLSTAVVRPEYISVAMSATGGLLTGASVASEIRRKSEEDAVEAAKVAKVFNYLYEQNKGLLIPEQLAFNSDIPFDKAKTILAALAESQGGQAIPTENSVMFKLPHPENVLDQLTANATAWAESRNTALASENAALKQQLGMVQNVIAKMNQLSTPGQVPVSPAESQDPWQNLIK